MMSISLIIHIISSLLTLLSCSIAWLLPSKYQRNILNLLTVISISTGIFAVMSTTGLTLLFCAKIGIYLLMIIATQIMLAKKIKSQIKSYIAAKS